MTPEQFWESDPWLASDYRQSYQMNLQRESEKMWLQGLYNFHAFSTALSNLNFGKKRRKPNKYMEEPIRFTPLTEFEKQKKAEEERQKTIAFFNRLSQKWKSAP